LKVVAAQLGRSYGALVEGVTGKGRSSYESGDSEQSDEREEHRINCCMKARRVASYLAEGVLLEKCWKVGGFLLSPRLVSISEGPSNVWSQPNKCISSESYL
jgi:hypothetical protein